MVLPSLIFVMASSGVSASTAICFVIMNCMICVTA
jgi:hypothetical protein